jgi:hypothetical protein
LQPPGSPAIGSFKFAIGDFNRDGQLDAVVVSGNPTGLFQSSGRISVLLGNGDGTFQAVRISAFSTPRSPYLGAAVGDFKGDGNLDLIIGSANDGNLCVRLGNGDGTFQDGLCFAGGFPASIAAYDMNGDGEDDLVVGGQNPNTVSIFLANGDGTFTTTTQALDYYPSAIAPGDFNGDGVIDLAIVSQHGGSDSVGSITLLYGNSDGAFQPPVHYSPVGGATYPSSVKFGRCSGFEWGRHSRPGHNQQSQFLCGSQRLVGTPCHDRSHKRHATVGTPWPAI